MAAKTTKSKKQARKATKLQTFHRFSMPQLITAAVVAAALGAYLTFQSFAASRDYTGTIQLATPEPYLGSNTTFQVTIAPKPTNKPTTNSNPRIVVSCFQDVNGDGIVNKTIVSGNTDMVYAEAHYYTDNTFWLGGASSNWKTRGGPASCAARLHNYIGFGSSATLIAETYFEAGAAR